MNNLLSYFGLVEAKIRASDKDLPVKENHNYIAILVVFITKSLEIEIVTNGAVTVPFHDSHL